MLPGGPLCTRRLLGELVSFWHEQREAFEPKVWAPDPARAEDAVTSSGRPVTVLRG